VKLAQAAAEVFAAAHASATWPKLKPASTPVREAADLFGV
jgi:hypothetical protein